MSRTRDQRLDICLLCDNLEYETRTCQKIEASVETIIISPSGACPIGKWGPSSFEAPSATWAISQNNLASNENEGDI